MRDRFKIESVFISKELLQEFYEQLDAEIPTKCIVKQRYSHLRRHFLDFFVKKDPNPVNWHRHHQAEWCNWISRSFKDLFMSARLHFEPIFNLELWNTAKMFCIISNHDQTP
jgi:hypothetical protein